MLTYENNIPGARITVLDEGGDAAVCCFWTDRDGNPDLLAWLEELKAKGARIAVVGNAYYWKPTREEALKEDMLLSARKIVRALANNPQIRRLYFYGARHQVSAMRRAFDALTDAPPITFGFLIRDWEEREQHNAQGLPLTTSWIRVTHRTEKRVDFPLPEPEVSAQYPHPRSAGHLLSGQDLTVLHAEVLAYTLRYGQLRDDRMEVSNLMAVWGTELTAPVLGKEYEPILETVLKPYAFGVGTAEPEYLQRYEAPYNRERYIPVDAGENVRRNVYPIWLPGDERRKEPVCLCTVVIWKGTITGLFRAHNLMDGWPQNAYLLYEFHRLKAGTAPNSVVLHSVQAGVHRESVVRARALVEKYAFKARPHISDAGGTWNATFVPKRGIVAQLSNQQGVLQEFVGWKAHGVRMKITKAGAWPPEDDGSHAGWLGDLLARCEAEAELYKAQHKKEAKADE